MIEVTCAACGSTQRFADADSGKVSSCAQCKARITVPRTTSPATAGGTGDVINLSDLPAPKRPSPLAGAPAIQRPPTMPALPSPKKPPPKPAAAAALDMPALDMPALELDDLGSLDLPAPVGPTSRGITDLPAPVGPSSRGITDLPAPVGPSSRGITDLPAPVGPTSRGITDLPAPVGGGRSGGPRAPSPALRPGSLDPFTDLPAPKPRGDTGLDLPAPKRASGPAIDDGMDLLAPRGTPSRPAEVGFDDSIDLPAPVAGGVDLPAPKGFFDDLPAPRDAAAPRPPTSVDLPAPKGFFDDLPAPRGAATAPAAAPKPPTSVDLPAPKGFFDDLPGPRATGTAPTVMAPTARPRGMDLDDLDLAPPTLPPQPRGAAPPAPPTVATPGPMPLDLGGGGDVPPLELDMPSDRYGGLDLPLVHPAGTDPAKAQTLITGNSAGAVSFKPSSPGNDVAAIHVPRPDSLDLDIDETKRTPEAIRRNAAVDPGPGSVAVDGAKPTKAKTDPKKKRLIALIALAVVVLGGAGGFFVYKKWKDGRDRVDQRDRHLADARRQLTAGSAKHWAAAADAAEEVLKIDGGHHEALGIAAQGYAAGYLEEGTHEAKRRKDADRIVEQISAKSARGDQVDKGLAVYAIMSNDAAGAIERLAGLEGSKDPDVSLYLGWAYMERRQWDEAIAAFQIAADAKNRTVVATYHVGLAQLAKGDLVAAKASFSAVNDLAKQAHLGAQIGIQAAMPADPTRRESELLAILRLKEIPKSDPRVVAWAWALAGDDALALGHLDAARDHYAEALKLQPNQLAALTGTAELALRDGRIDAAEDGLNQALALAPDDPTANLAMVDLLTRDGRPSEAAGLLAKLREMKLPTPEQQVRMHMLDGAHLEKLGQGDGAVEAYAAAQAAAPAGNIAPAVAQATLLGRLSAQARADGKPDAADAYAARSTKLLDDLERKAKNDPASQLALGRAFLAAGNGAKAEEYLEQAIKQRPDDIEANFQLVEALELQGKQEEAAAAAMIVFNLDPSRTDMALKLASTMEESGRFENAGKMYDKLLENPAVTVNTRLKAGMFWVRRGEFAKAGAQGEAVSALEPKNAAAMYLRAEAAYADKNFELARTLFTDAFAADASQAIYAEGLGRAYWQLAVTQKEPSYYDKALPAYEDAARLDPKMLSAQLGRAQLYLQKQQCPNALEAYKAALELAPNDPSIPYGIGACLQDMKDIDGALPWLEKSVKLQKRADAYYRIGLIYDEKDDLRKAGNAYSEATRLAVQMERDGEKVAWLTEALFREGSRLRDASDERGSCKAFQRWLSRDPPDPTVINSVKSDMTGMRC